MAGQELQQTETDSGRKKEKKGKRTLWKFVVTVAVTIVAFSGVWMLVLGRNGVSLVQGYLLARFVFVENDADLSSATDQALGALVDGLGDRWSHYRDEESYQTLKERQDNQYVGIGITVNYERDEGLNVISVTESGPADQAGIVVGDIIVEVDGYSLSGDGKYSGTDLISGESGTKVELTLLGEDGAYRTVTCTRKSIPKASASGVLLDGQIGYVQLLNFYSGAADSFQQVVDQLVEEGAESLIIDLRDNPGGYVKELTSILDYLLPEGIVYRYKPRWWFESVYRSDEECIDLPFVTIVNTETYSAAELLAAELNEFCGSPVVGEQTSGKGYTQASYSLLNKGSIGLSYATYYTGNGHSLIGEGIIPDVEVSLDGNEDTQLLAAINLLS